jgi:hypothetical protein
MVDGAATREPVAVRTWIEGDAARGVGTLVVQVEADDGLQLDLPEPDVTGLRFTEVGEPQVERIGAHDVTTRRFRFAGEPGSYEIPSLTVRYDDTDAGAVAGSDPVWVDLGQPPPELEDFADIADPAPVFQVTSAMIVGASCVGLTGLGVVGGLVIGFFALNRRGRAKAVPPEPPDVRALRQWDAVRTDDGLSDHDKAVALAVLFREYVEAVLGFAATAYTTSEILRQLEGMPHLPDGNVGRARRILRATDRIKFADAAARAMLFEELDDALRTFVGSTRPRVWEGDA